MCTCTSTARSSRRSRRQTPDPTSAPPCRTAANHGFRASVGGLQRRLASGVCLRHQRPGDAGDQLARRLSERSGRPSARVPSVPWTRCRWQGGPLHVIGWAADPDTTVPIDVHVYLDGSFVSAATANGTRLDVGSALPGLGGLHGYDVVLPMPPVGHARVVRVRDQCLGHRGWKSLAGVSEGVDLVMTSQSRSLRALLATLVALVTVVTSATRVDAAAARSLRRAVLDGPAGDGRRQHDVDVGRHLQARVAGGLVASGDLLVPGRSYRDDA